MGKNEIQLKTKDLRMQKIETSMLKSMHPVINLADKLLVLKNKPRQVSMEDVSSFLRFALDSLTLRAHSVYKLNLCRRELIRPDLNDQYKQLCSSQTPISKLLFGDDLRKAVKEISETNKVSQRVSYPKHGQVISKSSTTFFVHWPIPEEKAALEIQKEGENRSTTTLKVVQLGSKVSLPTVTSIPCVASKLEKFVSNGETIISNQKIFEAIRGVAIDFYK